MPIAEWDMLSAVGDWQLAIGNRNSSLLFSSTLRGALETNSIFSCGKCASEA
jgi:hypothetical protein